MTITLQEIDAGISVQTNKAKGVLCGVRVEIPDARQLLKPIKGLQQVAHIVLLARNNKAIRLHHVDLLLQLPIEECQVDVHLMDWPAVVHCKHGKDVNLLKIGNGSKDLVVVLAENLQKALHNQPGLVLNTFAESIALVR